MSVPASVDILNVIEASGLASGAYNSWSVTVGVTHGDPLKVITLNDISLGPTPAAINDTGSGIKTSTVEKIGLRVETAAPDYLESWQMMNSLRQLLINNLQGVVNNDGSYVYHSVWEVRSPEFIGSDHRNRQVFGMTIECPRSPIP